MGDMTEQDLLDMAVREHMSCGDADGSGIFFEFNGTRVYVCILPRNGSSTKSTRHLQPKDRPLQDHLIDLLPDGHGDYEEMEREVLGAILKADKPLFSQLATSQPPRREHQTLRQLLLNKILYFRFEADKNATSLVPIEHSQGYRGDVVEMVLDPDFEKELDIYGPIPWYTPEDIVVKNVLRQSVMHVAAAVCVDGCDMFCKSQSEPRRLQGNLDAQSIKFLGKILNEYPQQGSIRVPQLLGYIHDKDTKEILGFLRQWVPGRNLEEINLSTTAVETKQKWISQLRETVQLLNELGIVFAEVNPLNVIIDEKDDAWLVGGWDDPENVCAAREFMGMVGGDGLGLEKMEKFLSGNEYVFYL